MNQTMSNTPLQNLFSEKQDTILKISVRAFRTQFIQFIKLVDELQKFKTAFKCNLKLKI